MRKKSFGTDTCRGAFKKLRAFTALARCSRHEQPPPPQHPLLPARGAQLSPPQPTVTSAEMIFCSVSILPAHGAMPSRWKIVRTRSRTRSDRLRRGLRRPAQAGERSSLGRDRPPKRRFRCHRKKGSAARTIVAGGRSRKPLVSGLIQGHDREKEKLNHTTFSPLSKIESPSSRNATYRCFPKPARCNVLILLIEKLFTGGTRPRPRPRTKTK